MIKNDIDDDDDMANPYNVESISDDMMMIWMKKMMNSIELYEVFLNIYALIYILLVTLISQLIHKQSAQYKLETHGRMVISNPTTQNICTNTQ